MSAPYISTQIEQIRDELTDIRRRINRFVREKPHCEQLKAVDGMITGLMVYLHHQKDEIAKIEVSCNDHERGKSLRFASRGVGTEGGIGCFITGSDYQSANLAAFVKSKEEGEKIVQWFGQGAWLDYRPGEPYWIQVKVGVCDKFKSYLQKLHDIVKIHGVIRKADIDDIKKEALESEKS